MVSFLVWAAIFQGLFLCILYLTSKKHNSLSNKILAFFLLSLLVEAVNIFLSVDFIAGYDLWQYFGMPETKLFFPLFFFHYILIKLGRVKAYKTPLKIVYSVAFGVMGLTIINIGLYIFTGNSLSTFFTDETLNAVFMTQQVLAFILSIVVLTLSIVELKSYQKKVQTQHSDLSLTNIKWLWQFIFLMAPAAILWGVELLRIANGGLGESTIVYATWAVLFVFIYFISYKAFVHKDLFEIDADVLQPENKNTIEPKSNPKSQPDAEDINQTLATLEHTMKDDRLFLKNDLTIHELAKTVEIPARKISQSINRKHSLNFSEWVNSYRVEEAKKQLLQFSQNNLTIEGIGYDSGFNSRSAMYLAFKKLTGKSPGDFKR